jgi:probable rRNA maturation factor
MVEIDIEVEDTAWTRALADVEALARQAAQAVLDAHEDVVGSALAVLLTDDATVRDLNARFRGKDYATNVLSFPAAGQPGGQIGDIALAHGVCAREAAAQGKPLAHHLQHLVAHGVLHLLGYDHETDDEAEAMEALEREILSGLSIPDPYAEGFAPPDGAD